MFSLTIIAAEAQLQEILTQVKKLDKLETIENKLDNIDTKVTTLDRRQLETSQKLDIVENEVKLLKEENAFLKRNQERLTKAIRNNRQNP